MQSYSDFSSEEFSALRSPRGRVTAEEWPNGHSLLHKPHPKHREAYSEIARQRGKLADEIESAEQGFSV